MDGVDERVSAMRKALADLLPGTLCGEGWNLPDNETVQIVITFGKLRAARAALALAPPAPVETASAGVVRTAIGETGAVEIAMGHGLVDVGPILHEGRVGLLLHPRAVHIPVGDAGVLGHDGRDTHWPEAGDVVIWLDGPERGQTIINELQKPPLAALTAAQPASGGEDVARLDWLERNPQVEISMTWDDDKGPWVAHRVHGGPNDREWDLIGEGHTLRDVIDAARAHYAALTPGSQS